MTSSRRLQFYHSYSNYRLYLLYLKLSNIQLIKYQPAILYIKKKIHYCSIINNFFSNFSTIRNKFK